MYMLSKSKTFLFLSLFFVIGVAIASYFRFPFVAVYSFFLLCLIILIFGWSNYKLRYAALGGIFLFLGFGRFVLSLPSSDARAIQFYNNQGQVDFQGIVSAEPDVRADQTKLTIAVRSLADGAENRAIRGKVLVNAPLYPEYHYGDELEIKCRLEAPGVIEDFAYDKYLSRYNIYSLCYSPEITLISHNQGNRAVGYLLRVKEYFVNTTNRLLGEPQASFLGGLLLGAKRSIPEDLMNAFNATGTTHIVAISGYNITIIAAIILKLAQGLFVSRRKIFWLATGAIIFFVIITGAQASVIRAAVMGILVLLAGQVGRASKITNALVLAGVVMLLVNPKILAFDAGFQLSFLATIGLVYLSPMLEKYFQRFASVFGIKESLVTTLSAIVLTTPIILYNFGRLSLVAPLANVLVLPAVPITMALGFIAGLAGMIWAGLGQIISWGAWVFLSYIIFVVEGLAKIKFSSFNLGKMPWFLLVFFYILIGSWVWRGAKQRV